MERRRVKFEPRRDMEPRAGQIPLCNTWRNEVGILWGRGQGRYRAPPRRNVGALVGGGKETGDGGTRARTPELPALSAPPWH